MKRIKGQQKNEKGKQPYNGGGKKAKSEENGSEKGERPERRGFDRGSFCVEKEGEGGGGGGRRRGGRKVRIGDG
jgi:hypothetical protein